MRVLEFLEFDALLGMDWLGSFHAHISCYEKRITIPLEGGSELNIQGTASLLPITRGREATSDEIEIVASVMSTGAKQEICFSEVPVVCNFPDVFPEDLPGLPPPRRLTLLLTLLGD
ncbi:hypothetical protein Scep_011685 [Stephania cephalantha]|uniref:Reverse transcriptase domain-containing protein n=1 Tax=Stephania cephalantha TaxID=152367 RepID=A0AAP0P5T2_9MAGN